MQDVDMKGKLNNPFSALLVQESLWKVGNKTGIYLQQQNILLLGPFRIPDQYKKKLFDKTSKKPSGTNSAFSVNHFWEEKQNIGGDFHFRLSPADQRQQIKRNHSEYFIFASILLLIFSKLHQVFSFEESLCNDKGGFVNMRKFVAKVCVLFREAPANAMMTNRQTNRFSTCRLDPLLQKWIE